MKFWHPNSLKKNFLVVLIFVLQLFLASNSLAENSQSLIRDAQTEKFLYDLAAPLIKVANLNANDIKIHIIADDTLNAFVTLGQNMFINTGLILKYKTPDALIGVMAHEFGHMKAGHVARSYENADEINNMVLLSYLLGIGASLAGSVDAGQAIIFGSSKTYQALLMKYSRGQEESADKLALQFLDKISYPADGLLELLQFFDQEQIGLKDQIDEYASSHPVSKKRINFIKAQAAKHSDKAVNVRLQKEMNTVLLKLEAFISEPNKTLQKYQNRDDFAANYANSIAYYRLGQTAKAINYLDKVIANNPADGFLYELKGQILFEGGNINDSLINYSKSIKLLENKDSAQAKIAFAGAIISYSTKDEALLNLSIKYLNEALVFEKLNPNIFKLLSTAYSRKSDEGRAYLALAEFNLLKDDKDKALKYAKLAKEKLDKNSTSELLRAEDIIEIAKKIKDKSIFNKND